MHLYYYDSVKSTDVCDIWGFEPSVLQMFMTLEFGIAHLSVLRGSYKLRLAYWRKGYTREALRSNDWFH